ncbi:c-type cytochrome [Mucilaginibacter rubeus]|uniref:C-type cytochrome n=1 Tax=Mucilaginibacter rubeus TaxID=2027860 RepID=A0AAE6JLK2_9SPHI|nr:MULTISPECIES: cytochrome c3 family protein [Mucilaginibacter]QEM07750.1 c-type cytochrome [Mucilaginibacter rubeus]QEM20202.1 c-type cytochrome [Mucilaginibacter gossypii]QTE43082.1 c-type cytochrome [Mucilaginibacter rubeus]QTE49683.1 c-type cytochrome [Mucilaginibacter rubeus]QTE54778.1 c-type cytochrome [Mucilaginibacter rubeus]
MRSFSLILKQFSRSVLLIAGFAFWSLSTAYAQTDAAKGEAIFKSKCTTCHKIDTRLIGPALGPQLTQETDDKYLIQWIQNNQALIAAKNPKALKIYNEYNQSGMTVFADLSDADVGNIITYVRTTWKDMQAKPAGGATAAPGAKVESGPSDMVVYGLIGIIVIAFIVILVLNRVVGSLERILLKNKDLIIEDEVVTPEGAVAVDAKKEFITKILKNKKLVFFILVAGTVAMCSWGWVTLWNTNVHQGYQPVQPIKYSHELHAGIMKIDCQYCHSGAYKSKNASIPSLNVCMNCHKVVKTESEEIHKIYDALGYDPKTQKYDSTAAKPIQWVRIHNLPDLAYFNHSQHVKVGGIKCQQCHGPVQEMKEVYQYSPLTMKWCIQCHKRTEVNGKGNAYYDSILAAHDKIKKGEKVTAAVLGGIECGKCHY